MKKILISEIQNHLPKFQFLEYRNSCYTFENIKPVNGVKVYEHFHIMFALKDKNFSCSIASRINKNYIRYNSYNTGLINPHIDLIAMKKGTGVIPVEDAYYFHNGKVKTTTKIVGQIITDFKKYGKPFLDKQIDQLENSRLLKTGFDYISNLKIKKELLHAELKNQLETGGYLISSIKNETYSSLKSELQSVQGIDKETRKNIPKLAYELLDYYCMEK